MKTDKRKNNRWAVFTIVFDQKLFFLPSFFLVSERFLLLLFPSFFLCSSHNIQVMGERSLPSFDRVREALKGQRVGGILLGEPFGDEGHGAQGTVYRFENENFGQGGQPQYVAVKIMNYAEGMKEHRMYARAQSRSHPSDHIVKIFGHLEDEEKVCFLSS